MDHDISKGLFSLFKSQTCLESPVLFSCLLFLNDELWLLYLVLNSVDANPMYSAFWSPALTIALYIRESVKHLPSSGHDVVPPLQLHPLIWVECWVFRIFLIVTCYYADHVRHAAVGNIHSILVEVFIQWRSFTKMFIY